MGHEGPPLQRQHIVLLVVIMFSSIVRNFSPRSCASAFRPSLVRPRRTSLVGARFASTETKPSTDLVATTTAAAYDELKSLSSRLRQYDLIYYNSEDPSGGNTNLTAISDEEYDALARREADLCQQYPELLSKWQIESGLGVQATRYGGRVGISSIEEKSSTNTAAVKRTHLAPMLSLDNALDTEQVLAWLERIRKRIVATNSSSSALLLVDIVTEPKLDGLSLSLRYRKASDDATGAVYELEWASTRGNGRKGQDVTNAIMTRNKAAIQGVPVRIEADDKTKDHGDVLEVRGEVILPQSVFRQSLVMSDAAAESSNKTTEKAFSNARNAASGILLRKDSLVNETIDLRAGLHFYAYDVVMERDIQSDLDSRSWLTAHGFQVPQPSVTTQLIVGEEAWDESNITSLLDYHAALQKHRQGESSLLDWGDYDMDGCVHKVSSLSLRGLLGASNRAPRWAVAHKFAAAAAVTILQDILVQVGRTGALTPVAVLDPVELSGVTVQRATLHNFVHMQELFSGQQVPRGTRVLVRRAGDVIPQVVSRVEASTVANENVDMLSLEVPDKCPACQSATIQEQSEESVGPIVRCGGPALLCPPRATAALQHAFGRDALDITGLSDARIQQLMDAGFLKTPADVFDLAADEPKKQEMMKLDGWGTKSVERLAGVCDRVVSEGVTLSRFIYSLSIRFVGVHSSSLLAKAYGNVGNFLREVEEARMILDKGDDRNSTEEETFARLREETDATKGIGPVLLSSLEVFAKERELVEAAKSLAAKVTVLPEDEVGSLDDNQDGPPGPFQGMSVVFTGSVTGLSRKEAQQTAKKMGARSTPSALSKSTSLVIAGARGGKKRKEAEEMGLRIMEADEFVQMVDEFQKLA